MIGSRSTCPPVAIRTVRGYPRYTTTLLAMTAWDRGHDVCYVTPDDFIMRPDDGMLIRAVVPKKKKYKDGVE